MGDRPVGRLKKRTRRRRPGRRSLGPAAAVSEGPIAHRLVPWALAALTALPSIAVAQQAPAVAGSEPVIAGPDLGGGPTGDILNPENLFQLFYGVKTTPGGGGPNGTLRTVTTDTFKLRGDYTFNLSPDWQFVARGDLPYLGKDPVNSNNPDGDFLYGLGDADIQGTIIHTFDSRWKAGVAARLITPSGNWDNGLGSGKWQIMPGAGFRYALPEISSGSYFEPIARYDQSFAGDPAKKSISNLQMAPTVNLSLPDHFFFTLYPSADIRWNFGPAATGQTGRLFLPFDGRVGRRFSKNLSVSLEVGVPIIKQYPVYDFATQLRVNINF
jgi:hypothetical protein